MFQNKLMNQIEQLASHVRSSIMVETFGSHRKQLVWTFLHSIGRHLCRRKLMKRINEDDNWPKQPPKRVRHDPNFGLDCNKTEFNSVVLRPFDIWSTLDTARLTLLHPPTCSWAHCKFPVLFDFCQHIIHSMVYMLNVCLIAFDRTRSYLGRGTRIDNKFFFYGKRDYWYKLKILLITTMQYTRLTNSSKCEFLICKYTYKTDISSS